jgi:flagellar biosynthesis chaperone FliJ
MALKKSQRSLKSWTKQKWRTKSFKKIKRKKEKERKRKLNLPDNPLDELLKDKK